MTTPTDHTESPVQPENQAYAPRSAFARVPSALRLQFQPAVTLITVPVMIFFGSWLIAVGIGLWIYHEGSLTADEPFYTGASQSTLWALVFLAAYSASHTFPFSMALSYSRRTFMMGVLLAFGGVSASYGAAFGLAAGLERITDGFGIESYTFNLPYLVDGPGGLVAAGAFAAVVCLLLMLTGFFWAILYRRVGLVMLWIILLGAAVVILGLVMVIFQTDGWPVIWEWLLEQSAASLAAWSVLPVAGLAVLNYAVLRRATPA